MKIIPQQLLVQYDSQLNVKGISIEFHAVYRKWLRDQTQVKKSRFDITLLKH